MHSCNQKYSVKEYRKSTINCKTNKENTKSKYFDKEEWKKLEVIFKKIDTISVPAIGTISSTDLGPVVVKQWKLQGIRFACIYKAGY